MGAWLALGVVAAFAGILLAAARARVIVRMRVEAGRVVHARGRLSAELRAELNDALPRGAMGSIELVRDRDAVAVVARGLDPGAAQRVRNVVGRFPAARLRTAPRVRA